MKRHLLRSQNSPLVKGRAAVLGSALFLLAVLQGCAVTDQSTPTIQAPEAMVVTAASTTTDDADLATFREYDAVKKTLHLYIDNAGPSNGAAMRPAFFDHARIVGSVEGHFYNLTADQFNEIISADGKSPGIEYHIAWIDVSGNAAAAKLEFLNWGGHRFTDFFVLYKHEGTWKISGKVYDSHSKS